METTVRLNATAVSQQEFRTGTRFVTRVAVTKSKGSPSMQSRHISLASAVAIALAATGAAQAAAPSVRQSLDDIVVTATKRSEKLKDIPMGISAVTGDDLIRRNESGFVDFAAQVPGLSLQQASPTQTRLVLRGANVGSVGATVATVIDDVPFSMTGAQTNGVFFGANVDTYDLQRIEVLRGPQGTLYGATAEGGLIRYVTNAPDLTRFEGDVGVGGKTVTGGGSGGLIRGMVNIPLVDGKLAFRASAVKDQTPGWIDNTQLGRKDWNKLDRYSIRASLLWKPTDALSARLTFFRQNQETDGSNAVRIVGAALTPKAPPANKFDPVAGESNQGLVPLTTTADLKAYALNVQYDADAFSLMSSTSYGENTQPYVRDFTNNNAAPGLTFGGFLGAAVYGTPILLIDRQLDLLQKFSQELRITSKPGAGRKLDWQGGLFFTHELGKLVQPLDAVSIATRQVLAPAAGGADIPSGLIEKSAFADFTWHFTDAFDVEFGGRHSKTKQYSQVKLRCCVLFGPFKEFEPLRSNENKTTYSLAPRFRFADGTMIYARYATGYRAGGPNLPTATLPNPPLLLPDSTKNYEIGIRRDFLDRRISIDLAAFVIDWKDAQILSLVQTPTGPVGINGNAGKAKSRGLEWNLQFRPAPSIAIGLVGAYTKAKLTTDAVLLGAKNGDELPYVPDVQSTLNVDWTFANVGGFAATAGGSFTYTGNQYTDFSSSGVVEPHVKLPTYQTLKLQVGIDNGRFNAQVYANNLTNERAIVTYSNFGGVGQTGLGTFIQPRTVGVIAGYRF
jgi:outer membrane receptor protein involved in Fe transport